jgi:hypothetical protein
VDGTLVAQGATFTSIEDTPAKGDWGQILFTASSTDAVFDHSGAYVAGSTIQNSLIEWAGGGPGVEGAIGVGGASPFINLNTIQNNGAGGIHATGRSAAVPIVISGNSVGNNSKAGDGGGVFVSSGRLINNTVSNNATNYSTGKNGGGIYAANSTLIGNVVSANNSYLSGGGIYESGSTLTGNTVSGNTGYDGGGIYAVACVAIPDQIYDGNDIPGRGQLLYAPSLYSPLPLAQMIVPTDLITVAGTSSIVLTWTAIPALPDVGCTAEGATGPDASYRVYYDADDGCAPYDGQGLPLGNSPIDVGPVTTLEHSGLTGQDFYFVVTAHDYLGRESAYSNAVMVLGSEEEIFLPLILKYS